MWGLSFGGYGGFGVGYDDPWGVDRSGWSDKSDAALRRERQADAKFEAFLERCTNLDAGDKSLFPITEEVVGADVHLTGACYTSFRKRVIAKGCKVKRREATYEERKASGDKRKSKLYVISITCPVHPGKAAEAKKQADAAAAAKKKKAREAAERKAEKERKEREERERLAAVQREKVREKYEIIVGNDEGKRKQSPAKKSGGTMEAFVQVKVTPEALLKHAESVQEKRAAGIRADIRREESKLMAELRKKHAQEECALRGEMRAKEVQMLGDATAEYDGIKAKIAEACNKTTSGEAAAKDGNLVKENKAN